MGSGIGIGSILAKGRPDPVGNSIRTIDTTMSSATRVRVAGVTVARTFVVVVVVAAAAAAAVDAAVHTHELVGEMSRQGGQRPLVLIIVTVTVTVTVPVTVTVTVTVLLL